MQKRLTPAEIDSWLRQNAARISEVGLSHSKLQKRVDEEMASIREMDKIEKQVWELRSQIALITEGMAKQKTTLARVTQGIENIRRSLSFLGHAFRSDD